MKPLKIGNRQINTVFDLLGSKENDMTFSLGWCLSNCEPFLKSFCEKLGWTGSLEHVQIDLQKHDFEDGGFTDIEISVPGAWGAVIEAKRGYTLPNRDGQLQRYAQRSCLRLPDSLICILSSYNENFVEALPAYKDPVGNCPVKAISWKSIHQMVVECKADCNHAQKRLLDEFLSYLKGFISMQNKTSNMVYVVSLGSDQPEGWDISWIDIVQKKSLYFHPVGVNGWPAEPPNYIGMRYWGKLQSIRHVRETEIVTSLHEHISEIPERGGIYEHPHFLYHLGPEIKPAGLEVPTGASWRSNRVWCMLDTLLTCPTIKAAQIETERREEKAA